MCSATKFRKNLTVSSRNSTSFLSSFGTNATQFRLNPTTILPPELSMLFSFRQPFLSSLAEF
jgi:hypothetical protein